MFEIQGKYATAKVFAGILEKTAVDQINTLLNQPFMEDTQPRFMPDAHAGKGCVIGTRCIFGMKSVPIWSASILPVVF